MKYRRTNAWESTPGEAIVEIVIADQLEARVVIFSADASDLETHGEKCLLVAREMRRRQALGVK